MALTGHSPSLLFSFLSFLIELNPYHMNCSARSFPSKIKVTLLQHFTNLFLCDSWLPFSEQINRLNEPHSSKTIRFTRLAEQWKRRFTQTLGFNQKCVSPDLQSRFLSENLFIKFISCILQFANFLLSFGYPSLQFLSKVIGLHLAPPVQVVHFNWHFETTHSLILSKLKPFVNNPTSCGCQLTVIDK